MVIPSVVASSCHGRYRNGASTPSTRPPRRANRWTSGTGSRIQVSPECASAERPLRASGRCIRGVGRESADRWCEARRVTRTRESRSSPIGARRYELVESSLQARFDVADLLTDAVPKHVGSRLLQRARFSVGLGHVERPREPSGDRIPEILRLTNAVLGPRSASISTAPEMQEPIASVLPTS